jgi:hypothetical protein
MQYQIRCPICRIFYHRSEYRVHGGGIRHLCKLCHKKTVAERARIRYRIRVAREQYAIAVSQQNKLHNARQLQKEYTQVTYENRKRIKVLQARVRKTRATMRALTIRTAIQSQWLEGYNELLRRLNNDEPITTLREFMEGRQICY